MKVWGISWEGLESAARETGVVLYETRETGRACQFTIRPTGDRDEDGNYRWQRLSASALHGERRVHAVCWHGHRAFMRAIFAREPEARVKTAWADYRGSADFEARHEDTAYINVGSQMYPRSAHEVCVC